MKSHGRSLDILEKKRAREGVANALGGEDEVKFVLQNLGGYAFVAASDRLIISKFGVAAGASFGSRTSQFRYEDILNVAVNTGMVSAVIEIQTAAHQGNSVGDYWGGLLSTGKGTSKSPFEAENAFPCNKGDLKEWQPYLEELNSLIKAARQRESGTVGPAASGGGDLAEQLQKISELHDSGVLSDEEFAMAKARLLAG